MRATVLGAAMETSPTALLAVSVAFALGLTFACTVRTVDE